MGEACFQVLPFQQSSARGGHSPALRMWMATMVDLYVCNYRERALMDMPSARATFFWSRIESQGRNLMDVPPRPRI